MKLSSDRKGVELHIHLDACVRPETLFEIAQTRKIELPYNNVEELTQALLPTKPPSLANFLQGFALILRILKGDKKSIERITAECVEDCVKNGRLCYVELRFSPHILADENFSVDEVTACVSDAMNKSMKVHGIEARLILCMMRLQPEMAPEVIDLAIKYRNQGVVAIDIAGDDATWTQAGLPQCVKEAYTKAKEHGIHRTVHAGENSPAGAVLEAINSLHAERIGHGYAIVNDKVVYDRVREMGVHLETCPTCSYLTGAVKPGPGKSHPTCQFAKDGLNYSLNTDGPLMTRRWLPQEVAYCQKTLSLTEEDVKTARINAAKSIFIDDLALKSRLIEHASK